jgi:hypothetical protein
MVNKAKGPDNNKRLAELESGVSALAIALTANGFTVAEGTDPLEAAIAAVKGQAATIDDLTKKLDAADGADISNATVGEIAAIARAEKAEAVILEQQQQHEQLEAKVIEQANEIHQLNIDLEQLEARNEAAAEALETPAPARERPELARDFGPTFGQADRADLAELVAEDAAFEISFSNGEYEIVALAPVAIKGSDLMATEGRYSVPVIFVRGGDDREDLHGAVLVHGGEQIGYCEFPRPIELEPKQERRFERAITFG